MDELGRNSVWAMMKKKEIYSYLARVKFSYSYKNWYP